MPYFFASSLDFSISSSFYFLYSLSLSAYCLSIFLFSSLSLLAFSLFNSSFLSSIFERPNLAFLYSFSFSFSNLSINSTLILSFSFSILILFSYLRSLSFCLYSSSISYLRASTLSVSMSLLKSLTYLSTSPDSSRSLSFSTLCFSFSRSSLFLYYCL